MYSSPRAFSRTTICGQASSAAELTLCAPGIVALRLRRLRQPGGVAAEPFAIREMLDIAAQKDGEPDPARPFVRAPLADRDVIVSVMGGKFHRPPSLLRRGARRDSAPTRSVATTSGCRETTRPSCADRLQSSHAAASPDRGGSWR